MGSFIELNDTLQITSAQGFPKELDYQKHLSHPLIAEDFSCRIFEFGGKAGVRCYHQPPVRNFLVQNIKGRWLYWGLIHMLEVTHDNLKKTTSGKFQIIYIYTPEEMKQAHKLIDRRDEVDFFGMSHHALSYDR